MITQNIKAQGANSVQNAIGSFQAKGRQDSSGFDLIIDGSIKAQQKAPGNSEFSGTKRTGTYEAEKTDKVQNEDNKLNNVQASSSQTQSINDTKVSKQAEETSYRDVDGLEKANGDDITADEALLEKLAIMLQSLQETVMKTLQLTAEEFDSLLMEQGMSITDLLQPELLQQFILSASGETDLLAVLTNENLAASMNELLQAVEGLKDMSGLELTKEQMDAILLQAEESIKNQDLQETVPVTIGEEDSKITETEDNQPVFKAADISKEDALASKADSSATSSTNDIGSARDVQEGFQGTQHNGTRDDQRDLKAAERFQNFIENLANPSNGVSTDFAGEMHQVTDIRDIANQIIERIRITTTSDLSSMELQLNPEHLGKVNLTVQSKNGVMTAQFVVQNEISKEAIESQLFTLRETLNQQGIKVEAIEVTVSSNTFEQDNQDSSHNPADTKKQNSGKHITLEDAFRMTDIAAEEESLEDLTGITGSQINYTA